MAFKVWEQAEPGGLTVTGFFGGVERGPCLQVEVRGAEQFTQLDAGEARRLRDSLTEWLRTLPRSDG